MGITVATAIGLGGQGTDAGVSPRWPRRVLEFQRPVPWSWTIGLGAAVWVVFFGIWELAVAAGWANDRLLPAPWLVIVALVRLIGEQAFAWDILISVYRILLSFTLAALIAVPLGILMGAFRAVEAFFNPAVSAWRYLPAPSFIPLLLMWFGTGDMQKLALLFVGVIWFLITLIMDHTKAIRQELIETSLTLGADRRQVLWTVVLPAVMPNVVVALRQMLAVSWTYLTIAEITTSTTGIGAVMMHAKRTAHTDEIMAGIVTIGLLGLMFDYLFRWLHRLLFPYLEEADR